MRVFRYHPEKAKFEILDGRRPADWRPAIFNALR